MFFEEAHELLDRLRTGLDELARTGGDRAILDRVYRDAHSLKGAAGMVGYAEISDAARKMEQVLAQHRGGKAEWSDEVARSLLEDRDRLAESIEVEEQALKQRNESTGT